jgi:aspartate ammonia-lyase
VETRRQHNEPTGAITRDALAKQLADSTDRLKQKHGAKAIDFEVVVKDGRTILRPVVK